FFSSRRRHTRFSRDWSSDVCSSDLYDLRHYLQVDLIEVIRDLCADRPERSPRWWWAMIEQLPSWGAFMAAVQGGSEFRGWTPDTYLSADIWDATQYLMIKGSKKRRIDNPYPRPGS